MRNNEMREAVLAIAEAEQKIGRAVQAQGAISWRWAPWAKPSTGGPYMWNVIVVTHADGHLEDVEAQAFVDRS